MNKILIVAFISIYHFIFAQSGMVQYKESIKLQIDIPEEQKEMFKNMPLTQDVFKQLAFTKDASLYNDKGKSEDIDLSHESDGGQMNIQIKNPESSHYINLTEKTVINNQEFFGRYFLIKETINSKDWKVTGEQKKVLDYLCIKAESTTKDGAKLIAWFAPQIPVKMGPMGLNGLPGLILSVDIDGGTRTVEATKVEIVNINADQIQKPKKGKEVSREEFEKIRDEKMKEMGATQGKGAVFKIIQTDEKH